MPVPAGSGGSAVATPQLDASIEDFGGLLYLAESLAHPSAAEDAAVL